MEESTAMHSRRLRAAARLRVLLAWRTFAWSCALVSLGCASIGYDGLPPDVYVIDIVPLESTAFEQRMQVDLRIRNPNDHAFAIDGVRFDLDLNGTRFARGLGDQAVTVPRLGEARVSVISTTTMMDWVRQFAVLAQPGRKDLDYRVSGRLFLSNELLAYVNFESSGNLSDPTGRGAY
jgi:LEA14-like dessication related protein